MKHRPERMSELIRETLAELIIRELEFDGALVTITNVEVSKDVEHANVGFSVIPHDKEERVAEVLKKFTGRLQHELNHKLNLRPTPRILFFLDHGPEKAAMIEKDLLEIEKTEENS